MLELPSRALPFILGLYLTKPSPLPPPLPRTWNYIAAISSIFNSPLEYSCTYHLRQEYWSGINYFKKVFPSVEDSNIRKLIQHTQTLIQHTLWLTPPSTCYHSFGWAAGWQQAVGKTNKTSCHTNNISHFTKATTCKSWFLSKTSGYAILKKFMNSQFNTISFIYEIFYLYTNLLVLLIYRPWDFILCSQWKIHPNFAL